MSQTLQVGKSIHLKGCFTLEGYIANQNLETIARRLGLPQWMMKEGAYVAYALRIPQLDEFELAGVTYDSTDNFVTYQQNKPVYQAGKFQEMYTRNAAIPVNFLNIKKQYRNSFGANKLVKLISAVRHQSGTHYPQGTFVPQFLITKNMLCRIAAFIPAGGNFRL